MCQSSCSSHSAARPVGRLLGIDSLREDAAARPKTQRQLPSSGTRLGIILTLLGARTQCFCSPRAISASSPSTISLSSTLSPSTNVCPPSESCPVFAPPRLPGTPTSLHALVPSSRRSASSHAERYRSLLAFISAGIPLLVLVPISTLIARNKWDVHNSVIGECSDADRAGARCGSHRELTRPQACSCRTP